jgi:hypothetical protein
MSDTDRSLLEERVRSELRRHATTMFDASTPLPAPPSAEQSHRNWWPAVAAAVVVAAVAVLATTLARSPQHSAAPAGPVSPTPSTLHSTDLNPGHYPEATGLAGVTVIPVTTGPDNVRFTNEFPATATLVEGRVYPFTASVTYGPAKTTAGQLLVLAISAENATISCPSPFLIRPGHEYAIACTAVAEQSSGSVTITLTTPTGQPSSVDVAPFKAASLSGLGDGPPGDHQLLSTTGSGNQTLTAARNSGGRGELDASCIGGGKITVDMPGHGGFEVDCTGYASGASLPTIGTTVRVSGVTTQQWRVAAFGR